MKIVFRLLLVIAAAGLGLCVGLAWRSRHPLAGLPGGMETPAAQDANESRFVSTTRGHPRPPVPDDSPLATKLAHDLSMSDGVTRWLYWLEALEKASLPDFPRLAALARGNSVITRLIAARWVELSPQHLFDFLTRSGGAADSSSALANVLFDEWPKKDPDAVIAALSNTNGFGMRMTWQHRVADTILEKDVERGLRLMTDWHIDNYGPRMTAVAKWAAADPRHAAEFALENRSGYASQLVMETIGKEWAKTDPAGALDFASAHRGDLGSALATAALKAWAGRNLSEAGSWLAAADAPMRDRLGASFAEAWAKQDPAAALSWCEANLAGTALAQGVAGALKGMAANNVPAAAGLVTEMNPSAARAEAAVAVAQKWFPQFGSEKPVPPESIAWLGGLDAESIRRVLDRLQWQWSDSDPKSLAAFLSTRSPDAIPEYAYSTLVRNMARKNPLEAIDWASRLPRNEASRAGGEAFAEWQRSQPEAALEWLNELPRNDPRRQPFFENSIRTIVYESQGSDRLAALPPGDKAAARNVIETMTLPEDRRARLLDALR